MQTPLVADKPTGEAIRVQGEHLLEQVKRLLHEGNVRRIVIRQADGDTVVEFPLTVGVVGAALAPMLAAVGTLAALLTECTIEVERAEEPAGDDVPPPDL
ncbi:MAG TPA: DUF4342 domain-containing protein [Thermomicrobiales bacterium]|nr:DUF4342 domain-containing protein [Thermomicrobiales bacterium]